MLHCRYLSPQSTRHYQSVCCIKVNVFCPFEMLLFLLISPLLLHSGSAQIADNLRPFIGAPQGISFVADNQNFLARFHDSSGWDYVLADRANKDPFTKFHVHDVGDGLLAFECDAEGSGWFMQVIETWKFLLHCEHMGSVDNLGPWHKFQSYSLDGGRAVALRVPQLGTYLNRYHDGYHYMSPMDYSVTVYSTLGYDAATVHPTEYEILELEFDGSGQNPETYTPTLVDTVEIINQSDLPVTRTGTYIYVG